MPITKVLLIRKKDMLANLLNEAGISQYVQGEPVPVCPADRTAWPLEAGISHYAFTLEMPKLKDFEEVKKWAENPKSTPCSLLDWNQTIEQTLAPALQIHPDA